MPNSQNILEPITLVSFGRSGTSLVSGLIAEGSGVDFVGETAQLLFSTWYGVTSSSGVIRQDRDTGWGRKYDIEMLAAEVTRVAFQTIFPSTNQHWLHKPIGIPEVFRLLPGDIAEKAAWYWQALNATFPHARLFTVDSDAFRPGIPI